MSDYEPPMPIMKAVAASISQNTEQNVRTQSLQIAEIVERVTDLSLVNCYPEFGEVQDWMIEAEARGAEEQRRKDAEACERWEFEEPEYHDQGMGCGLEDRSIHDRYQAMEYGWDQAVERCIERIPEELYTRPANVAALEAEIASLKEAEQLARADAEASKARVKVLEEGLARIEKQANEYPGDDAGALGWISSECDALTREGGV